MQDWQGSNFGPMPIFLAANYPVTYSAPAGQPAISIDHNVMINAFIGKGAYGGATVDLCVGATFSNGACQGAGPYVFEIRDYPNDAGAVAPFFPGGIFKCAGTGLAGVPGTQVIPPAGGALSQWLYEGGSTHAPNGTYGPVNCPRKTEFYPAVGSYAVTGFGGVFNGPVVVADN